MLINCVAYQDGRRLADISITEIHEYLQRPGCFVWVALHDPTDADLEEMRTEFSLHPLAVEDAQRGQQRPKIEEYANLLFVLMHLVEPVGDEMRAGHVAIFAGPNYVLSVRRNADKGFQEVRTRSEREPELLRQGPGYVVYALMDHVVDHYFPVLERLEKELELIEEQIFAQKAETRASIEALYGLKQRLLVVKHAVEPLMDAVWNLTGARVPVMCSGLREYFRDISDHLQRLNQMTDSIRDTVATAIAVHLSLVTLQQNETTKSLAAYGALVAAPTMVAGIYGMNFHYMPELTWKYGYAYALAFIVGLDAYLFYRLRRAGWL